MEYRLKLVGIQLSFVLIPVLSQNLRLDRKLSVDSGTIVSSDIQSNSTYYCFVDGNESEPGDYYSDTDESTSTPDDVTTVAYNLSAEFLKCKHVHMKPECYQKLENDSVYIPSKNLTVIASDYVIKNDSLLRICSTTLWGDELKRQENKLSQFTIIITIAGFVISAVGVLVHMVTFLVLEELRNLPGYCIFSLCCSLALAYTSVFGMYVLHEDARCDELGMISYYFFLASFYWMNAISYDVWLAARLATSKLRDTTNRPIPLRFGLYSLYSWGSPLLFVAAAALVNCFAPVESPYRMTFNSRTCWIEHNVALRTFFAYPMFTLFCVNAGFFVAGLFMICSASVRSSNDSKAILWFRYWSRYPRFFALLRLAVVMGLTWTFDFLATLTENEALWIIFGIFTALQGIFIFFGFTVTDKTKKAFKMALARRRKGANAPMLPASPRHQETRLGGRSSPSRQRTPPSPS